MGQQPLDHVAQSHVIAEVNHILLEPVVLLDGVVLELEGVGAQAGLLSAFNPALCSESDAEGDRLADRHVVSHDGIMGPEANLCLDYSIVLVGAQQCRGDHLCSATGGAKIIYAQQAIGVYNSNQVIAEGSDGNDSFHVLGVELWADNILPDICAEF